MLKNFKCTIEYLGANYHGMQSQKAPTVPTIQDEIESALKIILRQDTPIEFSGRTDAGVHAKGQVISIKTDCNIPPHRIIKGLNFFLPPKQISILDIEEVDINFHPRFDAKYRIYKYHIINRQAPLSIEAGLKWHISCSLDINKMQSASKLFVGQHNFGAFRSKFCSAQSPIKTIDSVDLQINNNELVFTLKAKSFLHNMVRAIVGCLVDVGRGRITLEHIEYLLATGDKSGIIGQVAPPDGLYLVYIGY